MRRFIWFVGAFMAVLVAASAARAAVNRDHRWPTRGPWMWMLQRVHPQLSREFNGIDFGHAHLAETLLRTLEQEPVEKARLEVLDFIFSSPVVQPDEALIAPTLVRMVWETQKTFNWTHELHRSLYDVFSSGDRVPDKDAAVRSIMRDYLSKPEAVTPHMLDHMGKLYSFPESKTFRDRYPKFNSQIWAYHWLQGGVYDVQLMGNNARQQELMPRLIAHYHGYLKNPPIQWQFMPMLSESSPEFTRRYPDAAAVFDNLHMIHDNLDDVLCRPDLYPSIRAKRDRIVQILEYYLHRNHGADDRYVQYHMAGMPGGGMAGMAGMAGAEQGGHAMAGMSGGHSMAGMGPRPPSARMVIEGHTGDVVHPAPTPQAGAGAGGHAGHGGAAASAAQQPSGTPAAGGHAGHGGAPRTNMQGSKKTSKRSRSKRTRSRTNRQASPSTAGGTEHGGH